MSVASSNISGGDMAGNWTHVTQSWTCDLPSVLLFDERASNLPPTRFDWKAGSKKKIMTSNISKNQMLGNGF